MLPNQNIWKWISPISEQEFLVPTATSQETWSAASIWMTLFVKQSMMLPKMLMKDLQMKFKLELWVKRAEKLESRELKVEGSGDVEKLIMWGFGIW